MRRVGAGAAVVLGMALILATAGCGPRNPVEAPAPASFAGLRLTLASVGANQATPGVSENARAAEGHLAAALIDPLNAQRGEWEARHKAQVQLLREPVAPDQAHGSGATVLAFPADRLGDLVDAGRLVALPGEVLRPPSEAAAEDTFASSDILAPYRDQVARYGEDLMALPIGGSALVLVIRREALEGPENRVAADRAGVALEPPRTYEQLDALARFLHGRDWNGDDQPKAGIALALGEDAEGVADAIYLARAAALGQHPDHFAFLFDDETMEPRVAGPPFVAALEELAKLKAFGPPGAEALDAEAARAAYREGRAAMLIDRAERAAAWTNPKQPVASLVFPLPGSTRVYDPDRALWQPIDPPNRPSYLPHGGGWVVGVAAETPGARPDAPRDFVRYLAGPESTGRILGDREFPVLPTRASQLGTARPDPRSAAGVDGRSWSRAVAETLTAPRVLPGLRIPEADGYLADLAKRRPEVIAQGAPAETALRGVAEAWRARSQRLGVSRQLWHYRRSLNRPTATAAPPPRPDAAS